MKLTEVFRPHSPQWEAKVTQYEGDFDRVSSTVRKEVSLTHLCACDLTEGEGEELQEADHQLP